MTECTRKMSERGSAWLALIVMIAILPAGYYVLIIVILLALMVPARGFADWLYDDFLSSRLGGICYSAGAQIVIMTLAILAVACLAVQYFDGLG